MQYRILLLVPKRYVVWNFAFITSFSQCSWNKYADNNPLCAIYEAIAREILSIIAFEISIECVLK